MLFETGSSAAYTSLGTARHGDMSAISGEIFRFGQFSITDNLLEVYGLIHMNPNKNKAHLVSALQLRNNM